MNLTEHSNNNNITDKSHNDQDVDIVNYQTVSFDPKHLKTKRSLSLNVYKYEQLLAPKHGKFSSVEPLIPDMEYKNCSIPDKNKDVRTNKFIKSFGLVVSVCSLILLSIVVFLVIMNKSEGNARIIMIKVLIASKFKANQLLRVE